MKQYWALAVLAVMLAAVPTQPTYCLRVPPGYTVYHTGAHDSPYELAKRFYGEGYKEYKILEANRSRLTDRGRPSAPRRHPDPAR